MRSIRVERYEEPQATGWAGLVEGTADNDQSWIMFLDDTGMPTVFWPKRDATGGVVGEGIDLRPVNVEQ